LALDPNCLAARINRGVLFTLQDNRDAAVAEFESLLALPNPPPEASYYRGQLALAAGEPQRALNFFDRVVRERPQFLAVCFLRAKAELMLDKGEDALIALNPLIVAASNATERTTCRGHLLRHLAAQLPRANQKAALELARSDLVAATSRGTGNAAAFGDLAAVLDLQGRADDALAAYARATSLAPDDPQPVINRGWLRINLEQLEEAQRDFTESLKLFPDNVEALAGLGYINVRQNRPLEAQRYASLALLHGSTDYAVLHNVACIYAQLSVVDPPRAAAHEDAALDLLRRAIDMWRTGPGGPDEIELMRGERAFGPSLRARAEFKSLLAMPAAAAPTSAPPPPSPLRS
jgi:tetratricopeptide (TPR) repeat protein